MHRYKIVNKSLNMSSHPDLHFYQVSTKYSKGHSSYRADKNFYADIDALVGGGHNHFQIQQREIMPKVKKAELSFLHATHRLILFYISTKYHQNILKGIRADTKSISKTKQRDITQKVRKP